ncbi:MAG: tetratricopeptide repeat protein [Methylohalobius crimeensis]
MATHLEEEEQVEALKRWWKENGPSVIGGIVLGLAGIFGWNAWQNHQQAQAEQASELYAQLVDAVQNGKFDLAEGLSKRLTGDFERTAYADYARLLQAKAWVDQGRPEEAKPWLESVLKSSNDVDLQHLARLRLSRILLAMEKPEEGLSLLDSAKVGDPGHFAGHYEETKGDLYYAWGKRQEAREAYQKAIALGRDHPYLRMKLNDLGSEASGELTQP